MRSLLSFAFSHSAPNDVGEDLPRPDRGQLVDIAHDQHGGFAFACRRCCGLAYASQQEPVRERGITTARKIQMGAWEVVRA
jgi:hypothetical protein